MVVKEYANWEVSACNDGDNPVLSHIILLYEKSIDYRKLYTLI
jgi:hypothetical protein